MIKLTLSTMFEDSAPIFVDENTVTPRQALTDAGMAGLGGKWRLNGRPLTAENMDAPLSSLGVGPANSSVRIVNVPNEKNA